MRHSLLTRRGTAAAALYLLCIPLGCDSDGPDDTDANSPCQNNETQSYRYCLRDWEADGRVYKRSQPISKDLGPLPDGISVRANPDEAVTLAGGCPGMRLRVINHSPDPQPIASIDWTLYIRQEALGSDGQWHPIESPVTGFCNFSYFPVLLEAESYWELESPRYQGSFKTRLRFYLIVGQGKYTYSQEFKGSVNPEQLKRPPFDPSQVEIIGGGGAFDTFTEEFVSPASFVSGR